MWANKFQLIACLFSLKTEAMNTCQNCGRKVEDYERIMIKYTDKPCEVLCFPCAGVKFSFLYDNSDFKPIPTESETN